MKILAVNEENRDRVFELWGCSTVHSAGAPYVEADKSEKETQEKVWGIYQKFLEVGDKIRDRLIEECKFTPQLQKEVYENVIISPEDVYLLLSPLYPGIHDYYEIFFQDQEVQLEEDLVFPLAPHYSQYLEYKQKEFDTYGGMK